ncbi:MAG: hypothetical protein U9M92_03555 [Patescibacteria group bacterium]|nr:hypothetical protein [Patescibacteria group bacterium]
MPDQLGDIVQLKYLTPGLAEEVVDDVFALIMDGTSMGIGLLDFLKRRERGRAHAHVIVLAPELVIGEFPNHQVQWRVLHAANLNRPLWGRNYEEIAQCKAGQLLQGRNLGGHHTSAHFLFAGDTPYRGGTLHQGIIAVCSGFQEYGDEAVSNIITTMLIARAAEARAKDLEGGGKKAFV